MQPALNGIDRDAKLFGRLGGGQFIDVAQDQDPAVGLRKRRDRGNQILPQFDRQRLLRKTFSSD